ncbi:hypothetical protein ACGGZK_07010 [Agromyces sp. MMS24-K17]|uniref:hypothetical protein n=1 Tax=Agromyces sp. MMS24-K17 TaxID=3372850 RepID=UPI003753F6D7
MKAGQASGGASATYYAWLALLAYPAVCSQTKPTGNLDPVSVVVDALHEQGSGGATGIVVKDDPSFVMR